MSKLGRSLIDFTRLKVPYFNPSSTAATPLSTTQYWDAIYKKLKSENFEWAIDPSQILPTYTTLTGSTHIPVPTPGGTWLVIGNGTSSLPPLLSSLCSVDVSACDFSSTVVGQMKGIQGGVKWEVRDVVRDGIGEGVWDGVIDKGLIDGLHLAKDKEGVERVSKNVSVGLKPGGTFLTVSYSSSEYLKPVLGKGEWKKIECDELESVYIYRCGKRGGEEGKGKRRRSRSRIHRC